MLQFLLLQLLYVETCVAVVSVIADIIISVVTASVVVAADLENNFSFPDADRCPVRCHSGKKGFL